MRTFNWAALAAGFATLSGCAPMKDLGSSDVAFSVTPANAMCEARQHGVVVGHYISGQQSISVPNSPGATDIFCVADGYKDKRITIVPDGPGTLRAALVDFGPVDGPGYHVSVAIAMEPVSKQGSLR